MKRLFLFFLFLPTLGFAQLPNADQFLELGGFLGVTNYSGDVVDAALEVPQTSIGFGLFARKNLNTKFAIKAHAYAGTIRGDDKYSDNRVERNFKFSTFLVELGAVGEWKILGKEHMSATGLHTFHITPYLFAGVAATFADAEAEYYGLPENRNAYVRTDFPESDLKKVFITTPFGGGLRADISERLIIGAEAGLRPVYADDIDGISINGDPDDNDWYYFMGVTASFILSKSKKGSLVE